MREPERRALRPITMKTLIAAVLTGTAGLGAGLGVALLGAQPAAATSCVGWPDDVALDAVRGRLPAPFAGRSQVFTDSYDYALIGTVRDVDERGLLHRRTEVEVEVETAFYLPSVPGTVTLSMSDDGNGLFGYPFEPGRRFFIPVKAVGGAVGETGSRPLRNYVMLCDPVRQIRPVEAAALVAAAERAGTTVSHPAGATAARTAVRDGDRGVRDGDPGPATVIGAWTVILAGAAAVASVAAGRFRRRVR